MAADHRVPGLLQEMLDAGTTPEEVCRGCPELLAEVRERWKEFCRIDAAVVEFVPGLQTAPEVGSVMPIPPAADPPQVPAEERRHEHEDHDGHSGVVPTRDLPDQLRTREPSSDHEANQPPPGEPAGPSPVSFEQCCDLSR